MLAHLLNLLIRPVFFVQLCYSIVSVGASLRSAAALNFSSLFLSLDFSSLFVLDRYLGKLLYMDEYLNQPLDLDDAHSCLLILNF